MSCLFIESVSNPNENTPEENANETGANEQELQSQIHQLTTSLSKETDSPSQEPDCPEVENLEDMVGSECPNEVLEEAMRCHTAMARCNVRTEDGRAVTSDNRSVGDGVFCSVAAEENAPLCPCRQQVTFTCIFLECCWQ